MPKWLVLALAALVVVAFTLWRFLSGPQTPTVVVYVSHDEVFSEPILKDFEKETDIKVRAIYDKVLRQQRIAAPYSLSKLLKGFSMRQRSL